MNYPLSNHIIRLSEISFFNKPEKAKNISNIKIGHLIQFYSHCFLCHYYSVWES